MVAKPILLSWSGGKDCAWALHLLRHDAGWAARYRVVGLLTTVNRHFGRVAMHGFRESLLDMQGEAAGLPLWKVPLPWPCSNEVYEARMAEAYARAVAEGIEGIAFGDLFLEDIRAYRVEKLAGTGLEAVFPCWELPTGELARAMIAAGVRAHLACVDPKQLDRSFAGRVFNAELLAEFPAGVDPCGERGEFHTFVSASPAFVGESVSADGEGRSSVCRSIEVTVGEVVERDGFIYADLLPGKSA
jgi:diphthamide synthase (EF-2-diphthine--ammonia ligase)